MNEAEQIIALAKFDGWKTAKKEIHFMDGPNGEHAAYIGGIPNYLEDLNAVWKLEEKLTEQQRIDYWIQLGIVCSIPTNEPGKTFKIKSEVFNIHATARQKCEAILKTIGEWNP